VELCDGTRASGEAFEHFVILEIVRLSAYEANDWRFSSFRTDGEAEIDLIVERPGMPKALVEMKSTERAGDGEVAALNRFLPDPRPAEAFRLSRDPHEKTIGHAWCLPWQPGISRLGL
jgi:hypothetical protein